MENNCVREDTEAKSDKNPHVSSETHTAQTAATLVRHGSILSLLTLISRVLGLLREMTKARFLGTTALSDAFSVAFLLPNLFRRLFAEGSITVAFIPTFKEYLLENNKDKTREFLSCMFTFLTFFVTSAVCIGILAAPFLVRIFGVNEFDETVFLTRIMFPFLGLISLAALFQGILNSIHIFTPSGLAPILLNIVTIACAYALSPFTKNPARAMAIGIIIGGFLEAAIQLPFVLKHGQTFFITGIKRALNNPGTKKVLRLISPTIIGMAAYQLNDLVSTALARRAGEGIVSSLQYSLRLQELFLGIFAVSIGTVLLPNLTEYAKTSNWEMFNKRLGSSINIIALITIPVTFFSMAQGQNIIRLLFQGHSFDETSVALTLTAFMFHIPGLLFIALNRIIAPAFYAQSNTKSPTIAGVISFAINILLAAVLVGPFRGAGIAFALSFASAINTVFLLIFLGKNPDIKLNSYIGNILLYLFKMIVLSAIAVIPVIFLSPILKEIFADNGRFISNGVPLIINAFLFFIIGIALLAIIKDQNFISIINIIKKKSVKNNDT
ncbi:MAG: murein biosynthesis integral membrane protein MurJ [Treponema sp.]|nr:murein biosynthesis integral membrane protein MurJ [Treponema sp.]MCL2252311.1 murein biosynthesis integral membrane protein MurJ [Treponema sp.]